MNSPPNFEIVLKLAHNLKKTGTLRMKSGSMKYKGMKTVETVKKNLC